MHGNSIEKSHAIRNLIVWAIVSLVASIATTVMREILLSEDGGL